MQANINVRAIAQGFSEYNITVVVKREDCIRALRAVHSRFYLSKTSVAVGVIGPGLIGATLLNQLRDQAAVLKEKSKTDLRVMVLVDCTASTDVAEHYHDWLRTGIHVITPNKQANSGPLDKYLKLRTLQRQSFTHYFYEATVGAGLPIMHTLRDLLQTGDKIIRIEGIFRSINQTRLLLH
ncbi:Aspartate/homoserine dehydrogenase, NAD-binding [Cynara cardunculus var. scolymus]|uniref:aspartate kinase n=1 Tax=Cynara cardunculus var. scolymus TaxID=59895 RepID=A0A103XNJ1_CYNCS|nr:Aspartate/homoserine dehydrogenase, NAD-binding [Cynara cardunculus var. scolymus]